MGIEAAIIGSAVLGAGTSLIASGKQVKASKRAAETTKQAADASIAEQRRQFDIAQGFQEPRREAEGQALNQLLNVLGLGDQPFDPSTINIPGQQFAIDEASQAIERSAAARSGAVGGDTLAALADRSQGIANQNFLTNFLNPLQNLALGGAGAQAGQQAINLGSNIGNVLTGSGAQRANLIGQSGAASAAGVRGVGGAAQSGLSNFLLNNLLNKPPVNLGSSPAFVSSAPAFTQPSFTPTTAFGF